MTRVADGTRLEDYAYDLPPERIAQQGAEPRDSARLMVLHRKTERLEHRIFREIPEYLRPGDVLVLNQTRVIPARTVARKPTGAVLEVLLLREEAAGRWRALVRPGRRARVGAELQFDEGLRAVVEGVGEGGERILRFSGDVWAHLERIGRTPLPPYIHAEVRPERYQTVFARVPGSVAAPTAGLHFTPELLTRLEGMGVEVRYLTLHVGPGTFKPVKDSIERHVMHEEVYHVPEETARAVNRAKAEGRRVVAVGTTVVRALESAWRAGEGVRAGEGATRLFIRPPYTFHAVDALVTNFHLPRSTLLMLVAAFAGYAATMRAYRVAVAEGYRFYSLGDAMLIL